MKRYSASEAAHELGVDPKVLRRLLREDPTKTFKAPGSGASWEFSTGDMPALKILVKAHTDKPRGSKTARTTLIRDDAGLPIAFARQNTPEARARVREISMERVERLEAALMAAGLHLSQMKTFGAARREIVAEDLVSV
jgi:hypothetical protein